VEGCSVTEARTGKLLGRGVEADHLAQWVSNIRAGSSGALVLHGEAGIGKSSLLEYVAEHAVGCEIARATGVQSEMELAFAGLHQLCRGMFDLLYRLPGPQRGALSTVFGLDAGPAPDGFLIGLATLGLLSEAAEKKPLICVIDDHQWMDQASRQVLAFVARRLGAESLGLLFATREPGDELAGLPRLPIDGLAPADARRLLDSVLIGSWDEQARDQIVIETQGNPLALLELPRGRTSEELAGGFAVPRGGAIAGTVEADFRRRIAGLPQDTRQLLVVAAADPTGDTALVWRAAERLGIARGAAIAASDQGLADFESRTWFRHPLARSVSYWSASVAERQRAHRALADATDDVSDPDRRTWHLAQATGGPDEEVAAALERSAARAEARGGRAAAAAFLQRAVALTSDASGRAQRALAAAIAQLQAGSFETATELLDIAHVGPLGELDRARILLVRAQLAFVRNRGGDAPLLLLKAAAQLERLDPGLARETYLDAFAASTFAGRAASPGGTVLEVARAAAVAPQPTGAPKPTDSLLAGLTANFDDSYASAVPHFRAALKGFESADDSPAWELRWSWLMSLAALHLWDDDQWLFLSDRYLNLARSSGALSEMPLALSTRAMVLLFAGDLGDAASLVDEQHTVSIATGSQLAPYSGMCLAAMRGQTAAAESLMEMTRTGALEKGEGISVAVAEWTRALLHNGRGNYREAANAAQMALHHQQYPELRYPGVANWAAAELIEAAARSGMMKEAHEAVEWITEMTSASGTSWARGVEHRSRALLAEGDAADSEFLEAIAMLQQTSVASELARTHLLYGEWLRRERRRVEARDHLRQAHHMLESMGMESFAERARHELSATGENVRKRSVPSQQELTTQELRIAHLALEGLSNPEIGNRLFISARTVQHHLSNVFAKLGVTSRHELDQALPER
jgi:DNA-binding CsgD family transcriptional regulator